MQDKSPVLSRRQIRIKVFQSLYALKLSESSPQEVFDNQLKTSYEAFMAQGAEEGRGEVALLMTLFYKTLENEEFYNQVIQEKVVNWDLNRIALTDRILLQMGMCELVYMEEIPVKVSINEYLEIAKVYSTPKSNKFINGILDKVRSEWEVSGKIKKTGRGLINNSIKKKKKNK